MVIKCLCFDGVKNSENCTFRFRKLYVSFSRLYNRYEKVCNTSINTCSAMMQMYSRELDKFAEIKKEMI